MRGDSGESLLQASQFFAGGFGGYLVKGRAIQPSESLLGRFTVLILADQLSHLQDSAQRLPMAPLALDASVVLEAELFLHGCTEAGAYQIVEVGGVRVSLGRIKEFDCLQDAIEASCDQGVSDVKIVVAEAVGLLEDDEFVLGQHSLGGMVVGIGDSQVGVVVRQVSA